MEIEPKIEKGDFIKIELNIVEPCGDKNFMISFETGDKNQNKVYNRAIKEICDEHELSSFHQIGSYEEMGEQAWELWAEVTKEILEQLLPEIHARAKEIYIKRKELGLIEP